MTLRRMDNPRIVAGALLAFAASVWMATPVAHPQTAAAAGCVRIVASQFDAPGTEASNLNGEWVRIKNVCATRRNVGGWRIHDYGRIHTYWFPAIFRIGAGRTVTLFTGNGMNTSGRRYWKMDAPVWNNAPPEWAYLRNADGMVVSKWTEY